jgi:outer membrane immunogenic protein
MFLLRLLFCLSLFSDRFCSEGEMIRSLLLSTALTVVVAGAAVAADAPNASAAPAYAPPEPPVFSWTGFYIGANGGVGGDTASYDANANPYHHHDDVTTLTGFGGLAGGTVGFNYEIPTSNFVAGFEGDFDWSSLRAQWSEGSTGSTSSFTEGYGSRLNWLATARARLGFAMATPFGSLLPYVTGGAAFGNVTDYTYSSSSAGEGCNNANFLACGSWSHTWLGWTAGAGLEYAITQNLTLKAEYLYVDLGDHSLTGEQTFFPADPRGAAPPGNTGYYLTTAHEHFTANIVRVGLNWKFDWFEPPAPVVAKY